MLSSKLSLLLTQFVSAMGFGQGNPWDSIQVRRDAATSTAVRSGLQTLLFSDNDKTRIPGANSAGLNWAVGDTIQLRLTAQLELQPCEMLPTGYQIVLGGYLDAADGTICANSDQYQLGVTLRDSNGRLATHTSDVCVLLERVSGSTRCRRKTQPTQRGIHQGRSFKHNICDECGRDGTFRYTRRRTRGRRRQDRRAAFNVFACRGGRRR